MDAAFIVLTDGEFGEWINVLDRQLELQEKISAVYLQPSLAG